MRICKRILKRLLVFIWAKYLETSRKNFEQDQRIVSLVEILTAF